MENVLGFIVGVMENVLGFIVGAWFVASVFLTAAAIVGWLGWNICREVMSK